MKKCFFCFLILLSSYAHGEKFLLDMGKAVIFAEEGAVIITDSDIKRLSLDGEVRTADDVIFEQLMFQETKKYKIEIDEIQIDRYLETIQRENNLSLNDLKAMFSAAGYTYEEGREQMGILFANNTLVDFKVRSRLIVPEQAVRAYYDAHPVTQEAKYYVKRTTIPFDAAISRKEHRARIEGQRKSGGNIIGAVWQDSFWINESDIASDKKFIISLKKGSVSEPQEVAQGFELFMLLDMKPEHMVSFEDRYMEIVEKLRKPRGEELLDKFKKDLFEASSVVRF